MAYTNAWDETQPPDTQLANQLGADIRSLKTDVHERLLLSGTLAARPTPEAVFAGLTYFATDTFILYLWNGSSWIELVGASWRKFVDSTAHNVNGIVVAGSTLTLGPGVLQAGSIVRFWFGGTVTSGNNTVQMIPTFANVGLITPLVWLGVGQSCVGAGEIYMLDATHFRSNVTAEFTGGHQNSFSAGRQPNALCANVTTVGNVLYINCSSTAGTNLLNDWLSVIVYR
jgi:hypothetical protein